ncbi:conserved hypothetical protein [Segniliparus rotundus DSM 44985]|uniref:Asp23/Gls24 family envelope stress response protein n=1 Tax=Segniliparus rotundus (strain ATCC BAA-972 / CDC 1076 / CIP 108378 / DSM 44985 / JCM 13578) TaxID=640132 RepID=D6ZDN7_SEGRD|nr:hypothetical protein [Segniliparus rotundus]ADG99294.1 conserved hypothetical protein [Segniliparus rotundus DSM 44985]
MAQQAPTQPVRGVTLVRARARQRLIEYAALSVPEVAAHRGALPRHTLPSASTEVHRGRSIVDVRVAASWPVNGEQVVAAVSHAVTSELQRSLGERPDQVRVRIDRLHNERTPAQVAQAYMDVPADPGGEPEPRRGPRGLAAASVVALLLALVLIAAGVLLLREAALGAGWLQGPRLVEAAARSVSGAHWTWWTWPAAVAAGAVGLVLVVVAFIPRPRTHVLVGEGIWLPRAAVGHWHDQQRRDAADEESLRERPVL